MHGNVSEWTWDANDGSRITPGSTVVDPVFEGAQNLDRWCRGGNWFNSATFAHVATRVARRPITPDNKLGFRPVRTVLP